MATNQTPTPMANGIELRPQDGEKPDPLTRRFCAQLPRASAECAFRGRTGHIHVAFAPHENAQDAFETPDGFELRNIYVTDQNVWMRFEKSNR